MPRHNKLKAQKHAYADLRIVRDLGKHKNPSAAKKLCRLNQSLCQLAAGRWILILPTGLPSCGMESIPTLFGLFGLDYDDTRVIEPPTIRQTCSR